MTAFGFGAPTGVGLAGESRGLLREPSRWSALSLPTMSIGQEISVTALQMVAAFGAIANGGVLMQPRLVRAALRRRGPRDAAIRAAIGPPGDLAGDGADADAADGAGRGRAAPATTRPSPATRSPARPAPPRSSIPTTRRYSRTPGVLSFVGFAPADEPRLRDAGHARRAQEREVGQRGGRADLLGDRPRGPPLSRGAAARRRAVQIVTGPGREARPARVRLASVAAAEATDARIMPDLRGDSRCAQALAAAGAARRGREGRRTRPAWSSSRRRRPARRWPWRPASTARPLTGAAAERTMAQTAMCP